MAQTECKRYYGGLTDPMGFANTLKAEVYYSKGGVNWATGRNEERGYYFSLNAVSIENYRGCRIEGTVASSGRKTLVLPVQRQSQKRFEQAKAMMDDLMDRYCGQFLDENGMTLADPINYEEVTR